MIVSDVVGPTLHFTPHPTRAKGEPPTLSPSSCAPHLRVADTRRAHCVTQYTHYTLFPKTSVKVSVTRAQCLLLVGARHLTQPFTHAFRVGGVECVHEGGRTFPHHHGLTMLDNTHPVRERSFLFFSLVTDLFGDRDCVCSHVVRVCRNRVSFVVVQVSSLPPVTKTTPTCAPTREHCGMCSGRNAKAVLPWVVVDIRTPLPIATASQVYVDLASRASRLCAICVPSV